ncbi:hypothetical protein V8F20_004302 [Naviculisporaceae sp. PSN 640]
MFSRSSRSRVGRLILFLSLVPYLHLLTLSPVPRVNTQNQATSSHLRTRLPWPRWSTSEIQIPSRLYDRRVE